MHTKTRHGLPRAKSRGFTLVEMMVVIAIIGILAGIIIVNIVGKKDEAAAKATPAIIKQVVQAVEMFKLNHNKYPDTLNDLLVMPAWVDSKKWPPGGYLTDPALDGWNNPLQYRAPGTENFPFDIWSFGADEKEGGDGWGSDLWNRARKQ